MHNVSYYMALKYRKVVSQDEDGTFIVEVPDLPGCVADGDSVEEAFANLKDAMQVWIESRLEAGGQVPEPKDVDNFSGKFVVRIPKGLHRQLTVQAEQDECSLNQLVVALLSEAVGRRTEATRAEHLLLEAVQRLENVTDYMAVSNNGSARESDEARILSGFL